MNISNDKYRRLQGQQELGVRGANDSSMTGSRLQTSNIATILEEKERKRKSNTCISKMVSPHNTDSLYQDTATRDPRHVQQDLELELCVTNTAGAHLAHSRGGTGRVKQYRNMYKATT